MSVVEFVKATEGDRHDLIDFLDFVFSKAYNPNDFEKALPAQFNPAGFMTGTNYMARENGKIVANVGAYPADFYVCGDVIRVSGISSVAVHPRARSKGYMRRLMEAALGDMRADGVGLSFLLGQRQRYEYFGYTPCGVRLKYNCNKTNIRHHFDDGFASDITLKELADDDAPAFDAVYGMYAKGTVHIKRPRERFTDIMATWRNKTVGVYAGDELVGYFSASAEYDTINELKLKDPGLLSGVIGVYLNQYNRHDVSVEVYPHETATITCLSQFAESVSVRHALLMNVIDYPAVLNAFMKLKCETDAVTDGALTISIRDGGNITLSVTDNRPTAAITDKKPDIECTHTEAMRLLFSHVSAYSLGPLAGNAFARSLLPIPLFIPPNDQS
jgi:predicted acetyltransferase